MLVDVFLELGLGSERLPALLLDDEYVPLALGHTDTTLDHALLPSRRKFGRVDRYGDTRA